MATKAEELKLAAEGKGCLGKSNDNEPVFTLVGRDKLAPMAVRVWAYALEDIAMVGYSGRTRAKMLAKAADARALADRMEKWPTRKYPD